VKPWLRVPRAVAIGYGCAVLLAALGQRQLLYPRPDPEPIPDRGEVLRVPFDGGDVPLWIVTTPGAPLVVWFHGNAEQAATESSTGQSLIARGLSVAIAEYPGYGMATGAGPTETTILSAARATMRSLSARSKHIVCAGQSLGTGVAAAMAADGYCERLELISPYTSLPEAAQAATPWLPARWLVLDQLDTGSRAAALHVPTLIIHGVDDRTVPIAMGRALASAIPGAELVERAGRGHNDVVDGDVLDRMAAFARR
jgi:hypothetical protein